MSDWYAGVNSTNSGSFGWLFAAGTSSQTLTPSLFTNAQTFYAPTVTQASSPQTLTPDLYTNGQTYYAATISATYALTPAFYTNGQIFYAATVTQASGPQTLTPNLYTNGQTFYAPTVGPLVAPAGGYDEDKKRKKRFVVDNNGQTRVYTDANAALRALDQNKAPQVAPTLAPEGAPKSAPATLVAVAPETPPTGHYEALLALFAQQDEEDIEMLLLSL